MNLNLRFNENNHLYKIFCKDIKELINQSIRYFKKLFLNYELKLKITYNNYME